MITCTDRHTDSVKTDKWTDNDRQHLAANVLCTAACCNMLQLMKAEEKPKQDEKQNNNVGRNCSRSPGGDGSRPGTQKYQNSRENLRRRDTGNQSNTVQFLLREEIDSSDSEDDIPGIHVMRSKISKNENFKRKHFKRKGGKNTITNVDFGTFGLHAPTETDIKISFLFLFFSIQTNYKHGHK